MELTICFGIAVYRNAVRNHFEGIYQDRDGVLRYVMLVLAALSSNKIDQKELWRA